MGSRVNVAICVFRRQSTNLGFVFPPSASISLNASSGSTGVRVCSAISIADAVCHGMSSAGQQSSPGRCVTRVDLVVAGFDVADYEHTVFDQAERSLNLSHVDEFLLGLHLLGAGVLAWHSTLLLLAGGILTTPRYTPPSGVINPICSDAAVRIVYQSDQPCMSLRPQMVVSKSTTHEYRSFPLPL